MKRYVYKPIKVKIKHPWWHSFFTSLEGWAEDGSYEKYLCTKCNVCYLIKAERVEVVEVVHD